MSKRFFSMLIVFVIAIFMLIISVFLGASGVKLPDIKDPTEATILFMRLKRIMSGFITGAALSCAGLIFQTVLRNPLAEPYILGVSSGGGIGAALAIVLGANMVSIFSVPFFAFIGATIAFLIVFYIANRRGCLSIYNLIISGIIVSSVGSSLLMFLITTVPREGLHTVIWWMLGNLEPFSDKLLYGTALCVCITLLLLLSMAKEFDALVIGWDVAHSVGVKSHLIVMIALTLSTILTASVVSLSGIIGFVGLIIPHITRAIIGTSHRYSIPFSAIIGGSFLALCDAIGRWIVAPIEIPVGAITALFGGPFFLFILRTKRKESWVE